MTWARRLKHGGGEPMWDAKLNWAEEIYTMLIVLPVPVLLVTGLFFLAPWLHRRSLEKPSISPAESAAETTVPV